MRAMGPSRSCRRPKKRGEALVRLEYRDRFSELEPLLARVEKPSRYIDHEWGTASKAEAGYRACLIYPDVYEVGLPNQGLAILYAALNREDGISCERSYVPWIDMADEMRAAGVPLRCGFRTRNSRSPTAARLRERQIS